MQACQPGDSMPIHSRRLTTTNVLATVIINVVVIVRSQWSNTPDYRAREVTDLNPHCRWFLCFHKNQCDTDPWARTAHLLQCLGQLSLSPSVGLYNKYKWQSVNIQPISAYRRTQRLADWLTSRADQLSLRGPRVNSDT